MKIIFMGTPDFSVPVLEALHQAHEIVAVYCQPPRPAGRGKADRPTPVHARALALGLPVHHPVSLRSEDAAKTFASHGADVAVVVAYGLILPQAILDAPRLGCLNIHASLLPRWRGAAPIHRAIMAGDAETGVCIMQMEAGLDTGPVLLRGSFPIAADDTSATLHDRLAALGATLVVDALARLPLPAEAQAADGVTYAQKIGKAEALIDWSLSADELDRHIRAFNPFPGAQAQFAGQTVKLWRALPVEGAGEKGQILRVDRDSIVVACGSGALAVCELQKAGGKRLPVRDFLAGHPLKAGDRFDLPT